MTFFSNALKTTSKFGNHLTKDVRKFGGQALQEAAAVENFVDKKALPSMEKASKIVNTGLQVAEVVAPFVAPEALPFIEGVRQVNKRVGSGLHQINKGLTAGHQVSSAVKHLRRNDIGGAIADGLDARKTASSIENPFKR